jgi:C1A family cysteine protease
MAAGVLVTSLVMLAMLQLPLSASGVSDKGWKEFKEKFGKKYKDPKTDKFRRELLEKREQEINAHNEKAKAGHSKYRMAVNQLADLTPTEYQKMLGYKPPQTGADSRRRRRQTYPPEMPTYENTLSTSTLPTKVDWREAGWVGPVLNQGYCGSCYAYASAEAISSQLRNLTGTFVQLSPQNIVDCSSDLGNYGCDGGYFDASYWYAQLNGLMSLADYPETSAETGEPGDSCSFDSSSSKTSVTSWRNVRFGDEAALMQAVAQVGPVSVGIDAHLDSFMLYSDGVYSDTECTPNVDHAVLIVGYGTTTDGVDYWLVKNSWGTNWGMDGYFMMERNKNMCGVAYCPAFPVVE